MSALGCADIDKLGSASYLNALNDAFEVLRRSATECASPCLASLLGPEGKSHDDLAPCFFVFFGLRCKVKVRRVSRAQARRVLGSRQFLWLLALR